MFGFYESLYLYTFYMIGGSSAYFCITGRVDPVLVCLLAIHQVDHVYIILLLPPPTWTVDTPDSLNIHQVIQDGKL